MQMSCKLLFCSALAISSLRAEGPYFITYSHNMEEPGNLEVSFDQVVGNPRPGNTFLGSNMELEYGLKGWWTTELYLDGQTTANESTLFTGYRFENRFRPLMHEHWINPVLYVEYENINGADKTLREIVGHDGIADLVAPNSEARREHLHEIETKLILSSNFKGWNVSENIIAEKNLNNNPWEFGYAVGVSRPLALAASAKQCSLCRENLLAGVELYGGLGTRREFGLHDTSHYLAPTLAWQLPNGPVLGISPGFGLNGNSAGFLLRFTVSYEIEQFARMLHR
jgi:hypothetical protein